VVPHRKSSNRSLAEDGAHVEALFIEIVLRFPDPCKAEDVQSDLGPARDSGHRCESDGTAHSGRFFQHCVVTRGVPVSLALIVELRGAYFDEFINTVERSQKGTIPFRLRNN
jgi:hypothetical protein